MNNKILRKRISELDWKEVTMEDVKRDSSTPINAEEALLNGQVIYSTEYIYRFDTTPYEVYEKVDTLPADVLFTNNTGGVVNWSQQLQPNEIEVCIGGAFADQWKERLGAGHIISFPLGNLRLADTKVCPVCHRGYRVGGSLSRRDNETEICDDCGMNEAMEDMLHSGK